MPRIQGLAESGLLNQSKLIKSGTGYVFSITIAYVGAAAGNLVFLRDGLTGVTGHNEVAFSLPAGNGTITKEWPQGKKFDTGIWWDEGVPDLCLTELTFK